jgi:hypothetical protein
MERWLISLNILLSTSARASKPRDRHFLRVEGYIGSPSLCVVALIATQPRFLIIKLHASSISLLQSGVLGLLLAEAGARSLLLQ